MRTVAVGILSLIFVVVDASQLFAQRALSDFCDGWYCVPVRPLTVVPPIDTDMPANVREAYHAIDSFARLRTFATWDDLRNWGAALPSTTVFHYLKLFYLMDDFDPFLFHEYRFFASKIDSDYYRGAGIPDNVISHEGSARLHRSPLNCLLHSDEVLHIRIKHIREPQGFVGAEVLDALKGRRFQRSMMDPRNSSGHPIVKFAIRQQSSRCCGGLEPDSYVLYYDSGGGSSAPPTYGDLHLQEGMEAIVFLENSEISHEGDLAWYEMQPLQNYEPSGGVFVVDHGMVNDPTQYWSKKKRLSVKEFKSAIRKVINGLLNQ